MPPTDPDTRPDADVDCHADADRHPNALAHALTNANGLSDLHALIDPDVDTFRVPQSVSDYIADPFADAVSTLRELHRTRGSRAAYDRDAMAEDRQRR